MLHIRQSIFAEIKIDTEQEENPARHPVRIREETVQYQRQGPPSRGHFYQAFGVKEIRHAWEKKQWAAQELNAV
jgi:hypothetical protein